MKIVSWNINGIRAVLKKGFLDYLKKDKPDFLCLQEVKIDKKRQREAQFDFPGFNEVWNSADRPGYSGTAIVVKEGLDYDVLERQKYDDEGRVQIVDAGKFYLANVYFPNANHELSRLDFKMKFNDKLLVRFKTLDKKKPLIVAGDYNVAHRPIDLARPKANEGSPGYTEEERAWMSKFLRAGFIDTFRRLHPDTVKYSWWSYRAAARKRNVGWRIDYVCVSKRFLPKIKKAFIMNEVEGSDHCPIGIIIS